MKRIIFLLCLFLTATNTIVAQTYYLEMNEQGKNFEVQINWESKILTLKDSAGVVFKEEIKEALVDKDDKLGLSFKEGVTPIFEMSYEKRFFILLPEAIICNNKERNRTYVLRPVNARKYETDLNQLKNIIQNKVDAKENTVLTINIRGVKFNMIHVKGGTFSMGATEEHVLNVQDKERPVHTVTLDDYYIGQTEVTQDLWEAVMEYNPSEYVGDKLPVEKVTWDECHQFTNKLKELTGLPFRLPTEAEWEYAARGGQRSKGFQFSGDSILNNVGWYNKNASKVTQYVGGKQMNELGIYDMSGNVWEFVEDWFGEYSEEPQTNPHGPETGTDHILRGGSTFTFDWVCRVSVRRDLLPDYKFKDIGLRLAL